MTILDEVRDSIEQDDLENAKAYAKTLIKRQQAIKKNIANMEDEWKSIQKQLEKIDNKDFSGIPQPMYAPSPFSITTGASSCTVPLSNFNYNSVR